MRDKLITALKISSLTIVFGTILFFSPSAHAAKDFVRTDDPKSPDICLEWDTPTAVTCEDGGGEDIQGPKNEGPDQQHRFVFKINLDTSALVGTGLYGESGAAWVMRLRLTNNGHHYGPNNGNGKIYAPDTSFLDSNGVPVSGLDVSDFKTRFRNDDWNDTTDAVEIYLKKGETIPGGTKITMSLYDIKYMNDDETFTVSARGYNDYQDRLRFITFCGDGSDEEGMWCNVKNIMEWVSNFWFNAARFIISLISSFLSLITGFLIILGAYLIGVFIDLTSSEAVYEAIRVPFDILLQLTNFGIILAIILIGFMTMLRRENYTISKTLPQLIIIALLINFSWFIAVSLIDLSNELGVGILKYIGGIDFSDGINGFRDNFSEFFGSKAKFSSVGQALGEDHGLGLGGNFGSLFAGLILVLVNFLVGMVVFFTLIMIAIMVLVRWINLSILLVFMPFAILSRLFPSFAGNMPGGGWGAWFNKFTKWLFYFPSIALFLAIAITTLNYANDLPPEELTNPLQALAYGGLVIGILIAGLSLSEKMGLSGSKAAQNISGVLTRRFMGLNALAGMAGKRLAGGKLAGKYTDSLKPKGGSLISSLQAPPKAPAAGPKRTADLAGQATVAVGGGAAAGAGAAAQLPPGTVISAPGATIQAGGASQDNTAVVAGAAAALATAGGEEAGSEEPGGDNIDANKDMTQYTGPIGPERKYLGLDKLKGIYSESKESIENIPDRLRSIPGKVAALPGKAWEATKAAPGKAWEATKAVSGKAWEATKTTGDKALYHALDTPAKIQRGMGKGAIAAGGWLEKYKAEGDKQSVSEMLGKEASTWIKKHKGPFGTLVGGKDEKGEKKELEGEIKELSHAIRDLKKERKENEIKISLDRLVLEDGTKSGAEKAEATVRIRNYETRNLNIDLDVIEKEGKKDDKMLKRDQTAFEMAQHAGGKAKDASKGSTSGGSSSAAPSTGH